VSSGIDRELDLPGRGRTVVQDLAGPNGAPTLLLLHGLGATGRLNWGRSLRRLSEAFRVISVDHRGHGRGLRTRRFRLEECADDAIAIADACGVERVIPVGYSMGGPIASLIWRQHPDRVRALVLCATARHFVAPRVAPMVQAWLWAAAAISSGLPGPTHERLRARMLQGIERPEVREWITRELAGHDPTSILQAARALMAFSSHAWIGRVDVPSAVIAMTRDQRVPPARQRKLAASIPGAVLYEVDADHQACSTRAEAFVPALFEACVEVSRKSA
jgi:pimeloyl-ACP methyl ester carboxylesterase